MQGDIIYKYRRFDENGYHLKLLSHNELYFSSPKKFNDPFDCAIPIRLDLCPENQLLDILTGEAKKQDPTLSNSQAREKAERELQNEPADDLKFQYLIAKHCHDRMNTEFQVCAMTGNPVHILMWSHYSDFHQGFCVGFNRHKLTDQLQNGNYGKAVGGDYVNYVKEMPPLNPCEEGKTEFDHIYTMLTTKSNLWEYEEEYRIIGYQMTRPGITLNDDVIAEVILGCKIEQHHQEQIINILRNRSRKPKLYKAYKEFGKYRLQIKRLNY